MHQVRYAHCDGFTDICWTDKNNFITTGEDGDVRIWQGFDDLDNTSIRVGDKCFALAYKNGKIYVADDLNEVKKYDLESNDLQGVITSFTLPCTCIALNKSDTSLVCGSSDFDIHLVDLKSLKVTPFQGHDAPILSVCFDPLEKYFVSASCDGTARFWSIQTLNSVKTISNLHPKSNDFMDSASLCKIAWHKDGGLIAIPCEKEIHFYERETWSCKFKIQVPADGEFITSIVDFSPCGKYVLATTSTSMVYVFSIINNAMLFKYSYNKKIKISSLAWNPKDQTQLLFCDMEGNMGNIKVTLNDDSLMEASPVKSKSTKKTDDNLEMNDLLDLIEDDDSNDSKSSSDNMKSKGDKAMKSPKKKRKRLSDSLNENEDEHKCLEEELEMEADDDDLSLEKLKEKTLNSVKKDYLMLHGDESNETPVETKEEPVQIVTKNPTTQTAFQSSSTPLSLPERFMAWNNIGLITQYMKEEDESIDIEFHNATYHHAIHFKNQFGYTMADMSMEAIVMGSPGKVSEEELENDYNSTIASAITNQSKFACILINSCDGNKEWSLEMPRKEYIKCVCVSRLLAACMTSRRFLRVYGLAGTQKEIISFNGNPVCMRAYENRVFICYATTGLSLEYSIYYFDDEEKREAEHGVLPMSEGAKLEWLGFSDEGNPYFYDSHGYLFGKCLTVSKKNTWMPISDLRFGLNHKSDNHWLIGIAERNQMIKTILCKGAKWPNVLPRPTLTLTSIQIPFCEPESEKTKLEKEFWKNKYTALSVRSYDFNSGHLELDQEDIDEKVDSFEASSRETLMKLFMFSCKSSREQRAYEVASIMDNTALQLAIKYATKTRALVLAQNLNLLAEKKATIEYEKERLRQEEEQQKEYASFNQNTANRNYIDVEPSSTMKSTNIESTNIDSSNNDIIFESDTQRTENTTQGISLTKSQALDDSCNLTPSTIPMTATRLNPFHKSRTPLNDSSKSIINELEEKISSSGKQVKEKDTWRPTPTRKLTKSKVSNGTPTLSFK